MGLVGRFDRGGQPVGGLGMPVFEERAEFPQPSGRRSAQARGW
ncbi:hypothetical protein I552_6899 [Mycobacterium xenopi 3993]|nr:hypothetical protein I552_6899 [Mycobacterium xenopi 3993]